MRRRLLSLLLLLILLCGCGKKEAVSEDPQPETPEAAAPQPEKGEPETVVEGQQIIYLEPQYVYLEDEQEESDDLVFSGWNTETEDNEMAAARYQDISDVTNAVAIPAVYGSHGEIVTTPLRVGGMVELCAFDLRISYDNNRLK